MNGIFKKYRLFKRKHRDLELDPDVIFADAHGRANFDTDQFEGRLEKPISRRALFGIAGIGLILLLTFCARVWVLQIAQGSSFAAEAVNNTLHSTPIFATRGVIYDRNGVPLAWNVPGPAGDPDVPRREYSTSTGLAHVLGYVQYPSKDSSGFYYEEDYMGEDGAEKYFNDILQGQNGLQLIEVDAHGNTQSQNLIKPPVAGNDVHLSIDSRVQSDLFQNIQNIAAAHGFTGGAGVIMDVHTGEIIALTSYPEYDSQVMTDKTDATAIRSFLNSPGRPFLDRAVDGLYTPGSIVKPYLAMGALTEGIITPDTIIDDAGHITIPNPYDPANPSIFNGWKKVGLGPLDVEEALAMSSDIFFYEVGGGFQSQKGLGIDGVDKYLSLFGLGEAVPNSFVSGPSGQISTPAWKQNVFGEPWYLGDTYHTAIGQYGTQVTPVQMVRAVASIANGGTLLIPGILKGAEPQVERTIDLSQADFATVRAGMRLGVTGGISTGLNVPYTDIAVKTGTAQTGVNNSTENSWVTGFWPYENPEYAYAIVMENGPASEITGALPVMRATLDWMNVNAPQYFK